MGAIIKPKEDCNEYDHVWGDPMTRNPLRPSEKMRFIYVPCKKCCHYYPLFYVKRLVAEKDAIRLAMKGEMGKVWKTKKIDLWGRFKKENKDAV